jgi:hypothetical protein
MQQTGTIFGHSSGQIPTQPHKRVHRDAPLYKAIGHIGDGLFARNVGYKVRFTIEHLETIQKVSDVCFVPR